MIPLCALLVAIHAAVPQEALAPDGHRGFGRELRLKDVRRILQSPDDADAEFLARLQALESEIRVLAALIGRRCEERGYFALLGPRDERSLAGLHAAWSATAAADPLAMLRGPTAQPFARALDDARFRVGVQVLAGVEDEYRELDGGLALLRGHLTGRVDLREDEAANLGRRVDLAAAELRAVRLDLEALQGAAPSEPGEIEALVERGGADPAALQAALERASARERQMSAVLFTERVAPEVLAERAWRDRQRVAARSVATQVRTLMPDTPEGAKAPPDVARLSRIKRYEQAGRAAIQGLAYDPLDSDLNWFAGAALDFQWGVSESGRYFDRFLALRGIRPEDHRSYDYAELDEREKLALDRAQQRLGVPR